MICAKHEIFSNLIPSQIYDVEFHLHGASYFYTVTNPDIKPLWGIQVRIREICFRITIDGD